MWRHGVCVDLRNALIDARLFVCFAWLCCLGVSRKRRVDLFAPGIDNFAHVDN